MSHRLFFDQNFIKDLIEFYFVKLTACFEVPIKPFNEIAILDTVHYHNLDSITHVRKNLEILFLFVHF